MADAAMHTLPLEGRRRWKLNDDVGCYIFEDKVPGVLL